MQADAYAGFGRLYEANRKAGPIIEAACWAHARRKFFDLARLSKAPIATEAVKRIDGLFAIEREINGLMAVVHLVFVEIRRGDFVILRTGQMERCLSEKNWGAYAGGEAPGVKFENCYWSQEKQIAAICSDTWGVEVRPNETKEVNQPWHWVVIPAMGLTMGEMFYVKELAEDCEADGIYEFFFCGSPLIITGGTGSPLNPQAIK